MLLNAQGFVAEGTAENIFVIKKGRLSTPPFCDGALAGITRGTILEVANALDIPYGEESLTPYDLYAADECFLSGTGAELVPVRQINGRTLGDPSRPLFARLQTAFAELVARETSAPITLSC